ncbi:hypothetical protein VMUT_1050 [Vulcanisaeta moutnovskia 768-28]|uniref:Uncharacterized protein n=2 Tax=Vulcanisaeta TaxID=164450 RepID=F0QXU4_VULM7|nr:hypothetical protein VMUT_1050 [Vulcanisaeta moutnovskia 768-28]
MIKELIKEPSIAITQSPYALLTYAITKALATLITKDKKVKEIYPLTYLEMAKPQLLAKILKLLIAMDLLQSIVIATASKIMNLMGINVLIEDYLPTIILDHIEYARLYMEDHELDRDRAIKALYKLSLTLMNMLTPIAIYVHANTKTRLSRSINRGYRIVNPDILHDNLRSKALLTVMRLSMGNNVHVINNNGPLSETRRQLIDIVAKND